jgi:transposase InsO family protein
MDFVGPFPEADGYDYMWVVICRLTSMVHLVPLTTTVTVSQLANHFIREVVRLHGLPESIVSDRDAKFTSKFWRETHRLLGVKLLMSTAFHPQTDGASERSIRSVGQILRTLVRPDQRDWVHKVPLVEFAINSSISASTGFAPFELNYGYMPTFVRGITPQVATPPGVRHFV